VARSENAANFRKTHNCLTGEEAGALPLAICIWDAVAALGWLHVGVSALVRFLPFVGNRYDLHFPPDVKFARHAMAIDEYRRDFLRVPWGGSRTVPDGSIGPVTRFRQVWFAGNHSDIGGSYPENESRLSDITLGWMKTFIAEELPEEMRVITNNDLLRTYPCSDGMMHDELMVGHTRAELHIWPATERKVEPTGELHETVIERLKMPSVRNYAGFGPYRPKSLSEHPMAADFYKLAVGPTTSVTPG
jgi:hypothetical protein